MMVDENANTPELTEVEAPEVLKPKVKAKPKPAEVEANEVEDEFITEEVAAVKANTTPQAVKQEWSQHNKGTKCVVKKDVWGGYSLSYVAPPGSELALS
jgi:hypothetical protein